jgi:hypothetical protein
VQDDDTVVQASMFQALQKRAKSQDMHMPSSCAWRAPCKSRDESLIKTNDAADRRLVLWSVSHV